MTLTAGFGILGPAGPTFGSAEVIVPPDEPEVSVTPMNIPTLHNYRTWDNTEAVTFISHATTIDTPYSIAIVKGRNPTYKELSASGGVYTGGDKVWLLPASLVTAAGATGRRRPKPGDFVRDSDGVSWTILETSLNTLKSTWRCMTRNMVIAYDLHDTLTVNRPGTTTTDNAGDRIYSRSVVYSGIAARFQEIDAQQSDERGQRLTLKRYSVWVERRLYLTIEDQVIDQAGNVYEIRGWQDADRIDQLQRLECERRWG